MSPIQRPPAPPSPTTANPDEDESTRPGQIQLARWDVLLDASELPNLQKIATPLKSASRFYNAYQANGVQLRRAVRQAIDAGTLIRASKNMGIASLWTPDHLRFLDGPYFQEMDDPSTPYMYLGGSNLNDDTFIRTADNHLQLKLAHPDFKVQVAELTRNTQWITPPNQSLAYEGELAPGQAVAFIAQFPPVNDRTFIHLVVWETFQADPEQINIANNLRGSRWWCENGPAQLRSWTNVARVWLANAPKEPVTPAPFEMKLEDGKILRLEAALPPVPLALLLVGCGGQSDSWTKRHGAI